ncbi:hypothetical protein CHS0354_004410 [Potamilus streckersoni]|uniref:C-type lectin domain-containing protein n=1 Tax=Potamilus streckersoni TaxID=2493646 RepID=A0AAE0T0U6_9BIVA|nr:hypothetical protein CHS0354_004410 [Potamilus streckersoni]
MDQLLKLLTVLFMLAFSFNFGNNIDIDNSLVKQQTCSLLLALNCNYTLTMTRDPKCDLDNRKNHTESRRKRSTETVQLQAASTENDAILQKLKRMDHKLSKNMDNLSTRVLRGVRKMEAIVDDVLTKQSKRTSGSQNNGICPPGFQTVEKWPYCYLFSTFNTTWFEARDYCAAFEGDLVTLDTLKEHYIVTFLIKNNPDYRDALGWWTSGTFVSKTKQWMWTSQLHMRPFTFIKWASREPNETLSQCVALNKDFDHLWSDELCTNKFNFVCEISIA